jgi:hypothetical protein
MAAEIEEIVFDPHRFESQHFPPDFGQDPFRFRSRRDMGGYSMCQDLS